MSNEGMDRTPGYVDQLSGALNGLAINVEKASKLLADGVGKASAAAERAAAASDRYARRLAWATWALVAVTIVLAAVTASQMYLANQDGEDEGTVNAVCS